MYKQIFKIEYLTIIFNKTKGNIYQIWKKKETKNCSY
jgi:hypothetical protein